MNDRFESLMYHAGMTAQGCWDEMDSYQQEAVEKFALLIVKECAEVARAHTLDKYHGLISEYTGIVYVEEAIKQHFGIEQ